MSHSNGLCHTHARVTSHPRTSHATHTYQQAAHQKPRQVRVKSHDTLTIESCHTRMGHVTPMHESRHTHERLYTRIQAGRTSKTPTTAYNESRHTHECDVTSITLKNETCHTHTYQQAAHKMGRHPSAISHVTPMNESCHTHQGVTSHTHTHTHILTDRTSNNPTPSCNTSRHTYE